MKKIKRLDKLLIAQIAAGEVIESPSAALKELLENALDAKASQIDILLRNNGFDRIEIRDNGTGIDKDDLPLAVESFATSKLKNFDELSKIFTLGFRGEALGSMRSMGHLTIESKLKGQKLAYKLECEKDFVSDVIPTALPVGTRVVLQNLFANTPVRKKFQKKESTLRKELFDIFLTYALNYFYCSFSYNDGKKNVQLSAQETLLKRITQLYEQHSAKNFFTVYQEKDSAILQGYVSDFSIQKNNRSHIFFFVQERPVYYPALYKIITQVYGEMLPKSKFPIVVLQYFPAPQSIDVNVHPGKKEIRFEQENKVKEFLYKSLLAALTAEGAISTHHLKNKTLYKNKILEPNQETELVNETPSFLSLQILENQNSSNSFQKKWNNEINNERDFEEKNSLVKPEKFSTNCKFYGRLFDTFAVFACEDSLLLMDQHTAVERISFEKNLHRFANSKEISQNLLSHLGLQLSLSEKDFVAENKDRFISLGFQLEDMGPAGFSLQSIPQYILQGEEHEAFFKTLKLLQTNGLKDKAPTFLFKELAASLACRGAVKKGDEVSHYALQEIFENLIQCQEPFRCPHGRPTLVKLKREEIFLWFNRTGSRA